MTNIIFHEKQKITQWWIWLPLLGFTLYSIYVLFTKTKTVVESFPQNTSESGTQVLREQIISYSIPSILGFIVVIGVCLLLASMSLKTNISSDAINIQYYPFLKKTFKRATIHKAQLVSYGFVGYGIRFSSKFGTVYNTKGNKGLAITLKSGKKYLIGTQKPEELQKIMTTFMS